MSTNHFNIIYTLCTIWSQDDDSEADGDDYDDDDENMGGSDDSDESDDAGEDDNWGRKKKQYWQGDTADLEIGQDIADAEDEEAAALELHQTRLKRTKMEDYDVDYSDASDSGTDSEEESKIPKKFALNKKNKELGAAAGISSSQSRKKVMSQVELLALGEDEGSVGMVEREKLVKDMKSMSKSQRLAVVSVWCVYIWCIYDVYVYPDDYTTYWHQSEWD